MRREQHGAGDDERILIFLADALPVVRVGEDVLVGLQVFLVPDLVGLQCFARLGSRAGRLTLRPAVRRDVHQRKHVGIDHAQVRLHAQLASQQANRLEIAIDIVGAAGEEAGDEDALKRRHVELGGDWRFNRNLVEAGASRQASPRARS